MHNSLALPSARVRFAKYQAEYARAYIRREHRIANLYKGLLRDMFVAIACGCEVV
jgi:hypothetical protein